MHVFANLDAVTDVGIEHLNILVHIDALVSLPKEALVVHSSVISALPHMALLLQLLTSSMVNVMLDYRINHPPCGTTPCDIPRQRSGQPWFTRIGKF